jgi:hypothetical protein
MKTYFKFLLKILIAINLHQYKYFIVIYRGYNSMEIFLQNNLQFFTFWAKCNTHEKKIIEQITTFKAPEIVQNI